jgi:hypothetical protein
VVGVAVGVVLPEREGYYLLCAVRGDSFDAAASVIFDVDLTPPRFAADADVELSGETAIIRPTLHPPELSGVRYAWGAPGTVDCADPSGFDDFATAPLILRADDLPAVYCLCGVDVAGNRTPVTVIDVAVD